MEHERGILRDAIAGAPLVLLAGARQAHLIRAARELGSPRVLTIGARREGAHGDASTSFEDDGWRDVLEAFDPAREALVLGHRYQSRPRWMGRRFVGCRPAAWATFEDKCEVGALLETTGVAEAPTRVVRADGEELEAAHLALDEGDGTVWAGDHRDGEHSEGAHLRWVRTPEQMVAATEHFEPRCDRVRVMPFLDGDPCSIHGFTDGASVIVLRPVALFVDRDPSAGTFRYRRASWSWTPPRPFVDELRHVALAIGGALVDSVGYRGSYCVDGIRTCEGFRPTELNTRWGAALTLLAAQVPELALRFVHAFMADGLDVDWRLPTLARALLAAEVPD